MATAETLPKGITLLDRKMSRLVEPRGPSSSRSRWPSAFATSVPCGAGPGRCLGDQLRALSAAGTGAADRAGVRVREWLSRHGQRRRHCHLHALAGAEHCGGVVRHVQPGRACSPSTGTVAFAVITLLPVELILQVSSGAGFAMVFALLIAAILWNLGTWWFGLPASSSHTHGRFDYRRGSREPAPQSAYRNLGRGLGAGEQSVEGAADFAAAGICVAGLLILLSKSLIKFP